MKKSRIISSGLKTYIIIIFLVFSISLGSLEVNITKNIEDINNEVKGRIFFEKKQYEEALNVFDQLITKTLMIQLYGL